MCNAQTVSGLNLIWGHSAWSFIVVCADALFSPPFGFPSWSTNMHVRLTRDRSDFVHGCLSCIYVV